MQQGIALYAEHILLRTQTLYYYSYSYSYYYYSYYYYYYYYSLELTLAFPCYITWSERMWEGGRFIRNYTSCMSRE
jgi:hypothetical protein